MSRYHKPAHLQLLEGNKGKKSKEELENMIEAEKSLQLKADNIKPSSWLSPEGKKVFKRVVAEFAHTELLVNLDTFALEMFADAYADYVQYTNIIKQEGVMVMYTNKGDNTNEVPHPLIGKKSQAFQQMDKMMGKIGLSPADRGKLISTLLSNPKDEEANRFSDRV